MNAAPLVSSWHALQRPMLGLIGALLRWRAMFVLARAVFRWVWPKINRPR